MAMDQTATDDLLRLDEPDTRESWEHLNSGLRAPFPWFGGKSRAADLIWPRLGAIENYVEPFAGSLAVLLARAQPVATETVNDQDCYVSNFWRALQADPEGVARWADWPVNEADLHARHAWLVRQEAFRERMKCDPDYYHLKIAGWWVWGICAWIGTGWCSESGSTSRARPHLSTAGQGILSTSRQIPHLTGGQGVHRKVPLLSHGNVGVHRKIPHLTTHGMGVHRDPGNPDEDVPRRGLPQIGGGQRGVHRRSLVTPGIEAELVRLGDRMRRVRVCCGDWARVVTDAVTVGNGITGVLLDPPYGGPARSEVYAIDSTTVSAEVREWAIAHGEQQDLRIALCGYEGEHPMPDSWECVAWKATGGYGNTGTDTTRGRENSHLERIWFSPGCLLPQPTLF